MLIPELTILAAAGALILSLVNSLLIVSSRRANAARVDDLRLELDAALSASQGLARHLRSLRSVQPDAANEPEREENLSESEAEIVTHLRPRRERG